MEGNLSYRVFRPEGQVKAVAFTVHGMQEHKERYEELAKYLNSREIACITMDLPGHGETAGTEENKGWFGEEDGWKNLVNAAVEIARLSRKEFPNVPVVYFGHSMGTIVGRVFLQTFDSLIDGMVLSGAPAYNPGAKIGILVAKHVARKEGKRGHSALLDNMATGSFNKVVKNPRTPVDWLSYNEKNVDDYIADPWCGFPFTVQGYNDLFTMMARMGTKSLYRVTKPDLPIFFFAGEDDPCIGGDKGFKASQDLLKKVGYTHVDSRLYPHMRHETMHEDKALEVMKGAADWILENVK